MSRNPKGPLTPVRAIFHDVLPAPRRDLPAWIAKPNASNSTSSLPPQSAAALLHASAGSAKSGTNTSHRSRSSRPPSQAPPSDALLDARVQSATLAAEVSESWRPPAMSGGMDRHQLLDRELGELRHAILSLKRAENELLEHLSPQLLQLARMIAERVLETEALKDPELPVRLVREGLSCLNHDGHISVVLGTEFHASAEKLRTQLEQDGVACDVQVTHDLSPFACHVKAQLGTVDESLEVRLDHVLQSFASPDEVDQ